MNMEYAILVAQTNDLNGLVEALKRKLEPELSPLRFSISFDGSSKSGETRLLVFEEYSASFWAGQSGYYSGTVLFESEGDGRCLVTIVITGGPANSGSARAELRILDSIKNPILKVEKGVGIIYDSAWLYDKDETVRRKAVSSIERIGGECVVDKLIQILSNDSSSSVLEGAVLSLGRAGGDKAIDTLVKIARKRVDLVTACAQALGEMRTQKSLEGLKELLAYCEQGGLVAEAKAVRQAIQRFKNGEGFKEVICTVCSQPIEESEEVVQCPRCRSIAHKTHMLEWLHVHGTCPSCGHNLTESELIEKAALAHQQ
jgi:hypothetical protein